MSTEYKTPTEFEKAQKAVELAEAEFREAITAYGRVPAGDTAEAAALERQIQTGAKYAELVNKLMQVNETT